MLRLYGMIMLDIVEIILKVYNCCLVGLYLEQDEVHLMIYYIVSYSGKSYLKEE